MDKSRSLGRIGLTYQTRWMWFAPWDPPQTRYYESSEFMETFSHDLPINTAGDTGGPWRLVRSTDIPVPGNWAGDYHQGQFTISHPQSHSLISVSEVSVSEMESMGTTAIARCAPSAPQMSLATSLGELAGEGLPGVIGGSLFKERVKAARSSGSEYLNVEFGWLPLVRDVQSFAKAVKDSNTILNQYKKDSDQKVRRGYDFQNQDVTQLDDGVQFFPAPFDVNVWGIGQMYQHVKSRDWFRGAFKYHIPTSNTQLGKFRRWASMADHLLGVKPTPEVIWNIAPWSWAADWFTNTGDVMANISNLGKDGLVMQYGYAMSHREHQVVMSASFNGVQTSRTQTSVYKRRIPATPYGFGTNLSTLTPKQIAVLAALGLSKT